MHLPATTIDLCNRYNAGETFSFLYFWGHGVRPDGAPSNSCFSQWYPSRFELDGVVYATAEHYMIAEKARLFGDAEALAGVLNASSPEAAKAFGRKVFGFSEHTWSAHRFEVVVRGNLAKFSQNAALADFILGTDENVLVEASPVDPVWGIGLAADDHRAKDPNTWNGLNLLGFALMSVRAQLT